MNFPNAPCGNDGALPMSLSVSSQDGARAAWGPIVSGETYLTRDVLTDPPTIVKIVPDGTAMSGSEPSVTYGDIEPTVGWLSDRNNASLDICFMHSFGKCRGKAPETDPRTCHQIHIKRASLERLRRTYTNPQRHYFCRTMKANVSEKFTHVLSLLARRKFSLQYLEFRTEDVDVTVGSMSYEAEYRRWLLSGAAAAAGHRQPPNTSNFISTSDLCTDFAVNGHCPNGATCTALHGHVAKVLSKDRSIRMALEKMNQRAAGEQKNRDYHHNTSCNQFSPFPPSSGAFNKSKTDADNGVTYNNSNNFINSHAMLNQNISCTHNTNNSNSGTVNLPMPSQLPLSCFPRFGAPQQGFAPTPACSMPVFSIPPLSHQQHQQPTMCISPQFASQTPAAISQGSGPMFVLRNGPDNSIQLIPVSSFNGFR